MVALTFPRLAFLQHFLYHLVDFHVVYIHTHKIYRYITVTCKTSITIVKCNVIKMT